MSDPSVAALVVCCRVDDPHRRRIAGSVEKACAECGAAIAVSPAAMARSEAKHPSTRFLCVECGAPRLDGMVLSPPTGAQLEELRENGHDPAGYPLREQWGQMLKRRQ